MTLKLFVVFVISLVLSSCNSNRNELQVRTNDMSLEKIVNEQGYLVANLSDQCPDELKETMVMIAEQMGLTDLVYAQFETGIDSIDVHFGLFKQRGSPGYWAAITINDIPAYWATKTLSDSDTLSFPANTIDIGMENNSKIISFNVIHENIVDQVYYQWLKDAKVSPFAHIAHIELPIQVGKPFPELSVNLLNGDKLAIDELKGEFVVINYWHSACGPCIAAMPGLNQMKDKYNDNPETLFLAITTDTPQRLEMFLDIVEFDFVQSIADDRAKEVFGSAVPKYVILDQEGIVRYFSGGGGPDSSLAIDMALSEYMD